MNIRDVPDDQFITEAQRRVREGRYSPDEYMSDAQSDDRAKLDKLRSAIIGHNVDQMHAGPPYNTSLQELAALCDKLDQMRGNDKPMRAVAVNTTQPGREHLTRSEER